MALKSTIYKAALSVSDMDRGYYADHTLTIACHPSETAERMMVRALAFALNAHEYLTFGKGLSDVEEPDLWEKDLTGAIAHWIEAGQPDDKRILKACGRAAGTASAVTEVPSIAAVSAGTANARCTATTDQAGARAGLGR